MKKFNCIVCALLLLLIIEGCASVPKEVVELSYLMGEDIEAVHLSYKNLIRTHYQKLREHALTVLEDKWVPQFLEDFINRTNLIQEVQNPDKVEVLDFVQIWAEEAIYQIENKKKELINPINKDERELIESVDAAFANMIRANATITSHLNSIRAVKEIEDEVLDRMGVKELRDSVNAQLVKSSDNLQQALEKLEKFEQDIKEIKEKKEEILN